MTDTKKSSPQANRVLISGAILMIFLGIIYVWSVFVSPVSEHFAWPVESVKLTSSFMLCCFVLGILVGGMWQQKVGTKRVVLTGGLLLSLGMLLTAILPVSLPFLVYVTYGILGGFGVGMAYNAVLTCAQRWFPQRRGLATGISVGAFGLSTVIFAPLVEGLIGRFGVSNTFFILAAAFFLAVVLLFRSITLPEGAAVPPPAPGVAQQKQYATKEILRSRLFYYITISMMLGTAAYFILNPSFKTLAVERGLSDGIGTVIVMMTGIANALGRLAVPLLSDKIGRERAAFLILLVTGACSALLSFASGGFFMAAVAVIAFCYGGFSGVYPLITGDTFGLTYMASNYGAVMVGFAVSALLFPMLFGLIGNLYVKFLALAALAVVGAVLIALCAREKKAQKGAG